MKKLFILILFTFPMLLSAETNPYFEQMKNAIKSMKYFSHKMEITYFSDAQGGSTYENTMYFKLTPKDTILGAYFAVAKNDTLTHVYSGDAFYEYNPDEYGKRIVNAKYMRYEPEIFLDREEMFGDQKALIPARIKSLICYGLSAFTILNDSLNQVDSTKTLPDTLINGINCKYFIYQSNKYIAIDKNTNLPIFYKIAYTDGYEQVVLSDYKLLDKNSEKVFTRNAFPKNYKIKHNAKSIPPKTLKVGTSAPDFNLTSINGKEYSIEKLKGKPTFLVFSEIGCVPCMFSIPTINKLKNEYPNFNIVAIYPLDKRSACVKHIKKDSIEYDVIAEAKDIGKKFYVDSYPSFFIIDKNGIIRNIDGGYSDGQYTWLKEKFEKYK